MRVFVITFAFIVLDFLTGIIFALMKGEFKSSIMRDGLVHKVGSVITIVLGYMIDYAQGFVELEVNVPVANSICAYICIMEIGSIVENIGQINPQIVPPTIKKHFAKLRNDEEEGE